MDGVPADAQKAGYTDQCLKRELSTTGGDEADIMEKKGVKPDSVNAGGTEQKSRDGALETKKESSIGGSVKADMVKEQPEMKREQDDQVGSVPGSKTVVSGNSANVGPGSEPEAAKENEKKGPPDDEGDDEDDEDDDEDDEDFVEKEGAEGDEEGDTDDGDDDDEDEEDEDDEEDDDDDDEDAPDDPVAIYEYMLASGIPQRSMPDVYAALGVWNCRNCTQLNQKENENCKECGTRQGEMGLPKVESWIDDAGIGKVAEAKAEGETVSKLNDKSDGNDSASSSLNERGSEDVVSSKEGQTSNQTDEKAGTRAQSAPPRGKTIGTWIGYDERMQKHRDKEPKNIFEIHPERPDRIAAIWKGLHDAGLAERCTMSPPVEVSTDSLLLCHSAAHLEYLNLVWQEESYQINGDTYACKETRQAAALSAGITVDLTRRVLNGEAKNAFAIVRPPGHHAEMDQAMGFCMYNNVAVAAKVAREEMGVERVLIVDWDVHHGNGTEHMFESDPSVMYTSIHRFDRGDFYPGTGSPYSIGKGEGLGYTVNVGWPCGGMGDAEYVAAFCHLLLPIFYQFQPQLVLVSAGFDSAEGDPLGGCKVSPAGYAFMTSVLSTLAGGKIVVALEGGYNLLSITRSAVSVVKTLLGHPVPPLNLRSPSLAALHSLSLSQKLLAPYWDILRINSHRPLGVGGTSSPTSTGELDRLHLHSPLSSPSHGLQTQQLHHYHHHHHHHSDPHHHLQHHVESSAAAPAPSSSPSTTSSSASSAPSSRSLPTSMSSSSSSSSPQSSSSSFKASLSHSNSLELPHSPLATEDMDHESLKDQGDDSGRHSDLGLHPQMRHMSALAASPPFSPPFLASPLHSQQSDSSISLDPSALPPSALSDPTHSSTAPAMSLHDGRGSVALPKGISMKPGQSVYFSSPISSPRNTKEVEHVEDKGKKNEAKDLLTGASEGVSDETSSNPTAKIRARSVVQPSQNTLKRPNSEIGGTLEGASADHSKEEGTGSGESQNARTEENLDTRKKAKTQNSADTIEASTSQPTLSSAPASGKQESKALSEASMRGGSDRALVGDEQRTKSTKDSGAEGSAADSSSSSLLPEKPSKRYNYKEYFF